MILLDRNNKPENTVYYLAALSYGFISKNKGLDYSELYEKLSEKNNHKDINFEFFSLALNFLFLVDKISVDEKGGLYVY